MGGRLLSSAVALSAVTKTFGATRAIDGLSLEVPEGSLYGFIGPNGAGKTTTIRIVMSILLPDSGGVSVLGQGSALAAKDRIGYLPEERGTYRKMRVGKFLAYMGRLKGLHSSTIAHRVRLRLETLGLAEYENQKCEELSKGTQHKVQFLGAVIHDPDLLILDEPFSGLDPVSTMQLRALILAEHARGATILFSTHVMAHAEELCDHVIMIDRGRKVLDDPVATILGRFDPLTIRLEPLDAQADERALRSVPGVERVARCGSGFEVRLAAGTDPGAAVAGLATAVPSSRIELARPSLEDIFISIADPGRGA